MKRLGIGAAATAAALLVPAAATATPSRYAGKFESSGTLSFALARKDGRRFIPKDSLVFKHLALSCTDGDHTGSGQFVAAIRVRQGEFQKTLVANGPGADATLKLTGRLRAHGAKATGTIDLSGTAVPVDPVGGGETADCQSGVVDWTAIRR